MRLEEPGLDSPPVVAPAGAWRMMVVFGVVTLILGLLVSFHPSNTLNVIAVLLGLLMILAGIFHLVRVFESTELHRVWTGISGLLLVVIGVILIRHLHLTVAIIGLMVGVSWIVQGLAALAAGFSAGSHEGRGWWIFFGIMSLAGGIVITAVPVESVTALAVLIGIWFAVEGVFEIVGGFMLRRAISTPRADTGATAL